MLPAQTTLGPIALRVHNIDRMYAFYTQALQFRLHDKLDNGTVVMGADDEVLLYLIPDPDAKPEPRATGLYHIAYRYPSRAALGAILNHYVSLGLKLEGASDHGVSEALYLSDVEGNGIELYHDRPRDAWPKDTNGGLAMVTDRIDLQALLADAGDAELPVIGHVHMHVAKLGQSRTFYVDLLGFDLMQQFGLSAEFVSANGYHHHVGYNIWRGANIPAPTLHATGLVWWTLRLPTSVDVDAVAARLTAANYPFALEDAVLLVRDPAGNQVGIVVL